jgi:hypothetical protein
LEAPENNNNFVSFLFLSADLKEATQGYYEIHSALLPIHTVATASLAVDILGCDLNPRSQPHSNYWSKPQCVNLGVIAALKF